MQSFLKNKFTIFIIFIVVIFKIDSAESSEDNKTKISNLFERLQLIANGNYIPNPKDTTLEEGMWFKDFLDNAISNWGELQKFVPINFISDTEASLIFFLKDNSYELYVTLDEKGEWDLIKLTNYSDPKHKPELSYNELGDDTLALQTINKFSDFIYQFNVDSGMVRLVSILSPT